MLLWQAIGDLEHIVGERYRPLPRLKSLELEGHRCLLRAMDEPDRDGR
jgi:hypothetical protein